jgi:hypothetical protein
MGNCQRIFAVMLFVAVVASPCAGLAQEDCRLYGTVIAEPNPGDPALGAWLYSLIVTWDTGSQWAMSHVDLLMDEPNGHCSCSDFMSALTWGDHIGSGLGDPLPCLLFYDGEILCNGDPSTGTEGTILKFEPREDESCEPATAGTVHVAFYSNYPPGPIADDNLFLFDKFAGFVCYGPISGVFPMLPCDPISGEASSWGSVKSIYHQR